MGTGEIEVTSIELTLSPANLTSLKT